jgi:hypothetical protein
MIEQAPTALDAAMIYTGALIEATGMDELEITDRLRRIPLTSMSVLEGILTSEFGAGLSIRAAGLILVYSHVYEVVLYGHLFDRKEIEIAKASAEWEAEGMDEKKIKKKVAKLGMMLKGEFDAITSEIMKVTGLQAMIDALEAEKKALKGAKKK